MFKKLILCFLFALKAVKTTNEQAQDSGNLDNENSPSNLDYIAGEPTEYEDFAKILTSPVYAVKDFYVDVAYRTKDVRIFSFEFVTYGFANSRREVQFRHRFVVPTSTADIEVKRIRVVLPDAVVYKENRALNIVSDLHIENAFLSFSMFDGGVWLNTEDLDNSFEVTASDAKEIMLLSPWKRPQKPGLCFSWIWDNLFPVYDKKIIKCDPINDVVDIIQFPVALTGKEEGFKRFMVPLTWPDKQLLENDHNFNPRFTVSVLMYLLEPCSGPGLCGIVHHRNKDFLTPLLALTTTGQLHVQFAFSDGSAYAFLTNGHLSTRTWVHLVMAVDGTFIRISTKYGKNLQESQNFKHNMSERGMPHYNDTDGYWVIGGTSGFTSFTGFIGHLRIYRRVAVLHNQVSIPPDVHLISRSGLEEHFQQCSKLSTNVEEQILDHVYAIDPNDMETADRCPFIEKTLWNILEERSKAYKSKRFCDVPLFGETPDFDKVVLAAVRNGTTNTSSVSESLYNTAINILAQNVQRAPYVENLLKIPSCLGHGRSLHALSVMRTAGLGVPRDMAKSWLYSLVGAMYNHPLSQMSAGYKHLIGVDGVRPDCEVALGYYKASATTTESILAQHNEIDTHSEAVRLDDYDALAVHKGKNSEYFQWFTHQALQGVVDAQSLLGEMYYWGKHGIQRDLRQAVKFYEMGAAKGDPQGLFNLGITKLKGQGIEKNETEALELFRQAAEKDFAPAYNALGFYEVNMRSNYSGGAIYFQLSAAKGDRDGLFNMGIATDNGWVPGVARDKKRAFKYWLDAATKGHPTACLFMGEGMSTGEHVDRNCPMGVVYLRYVAEQHPEVGQYLRNGLEAYYDSDWSRSMVYFLLASEAGLEVPQYNTAMLCEENAEYVKGLTSVDCVWRYYNYSAELGWVFSMIKVGDNHWYGKTVPRNVTRAAEMYGKAAAKNDHPHALYNLAFMVEYNYSLNGIYWNHVRKEDVLKGNLTFAAHLYRKCRDATENNNESFLPCATGVMRTTLKQLWREHGPLTKLGVGVVVLVLGLILTLVFITEEQLG